MKLRGDCFDDNMEIVKDFGGEIPFPLWHDFSGTLFLF
jgi:hypothetical protein